MEGLYKDKEVMLKNLLPNIIKMRTNANDKILKLLKKASKDSKIDVKVQTDILNKVSVGGEVHKDSSSEMGGEQKLEMMKMWFGNAKDTMDAFNNDIKRTYGSSLKSIDDLSFALTGLFLDKAITRAF